MDFDIRGPVYAPYVPLMTTALMKVKEVVVSEAVVEVLPPSDDGTIQVGEGDGPAVLVPKVTETVVIDPFADAMASPRAGLLSRYDKAQIDPDYYKNLSLTATS